MNDDEECCLVCGHSDYEDGNEIGFCDKCNISVHLKCYGLEDGSFLCDFVCDQCKAFGLEPGMLVQC
jgi:origin recognition complex subunit 4